MTNKSPSKTPKANNKIVEERSWINSITSIVKQPLESDTDAKLHDERIITVRKEPIQGVQDCTCECPKNQAGTGKNTHIEIREVDAWWFDPC